MAKTELGTKRTCPSCGKKYYDLGRKPIVCPSCGTVFELTVPPQRPVRTAEAKPVKREEPVEVEREEGVVSLEDAEAEESAAETGGDDDEPAIPDVAVEVEDESDDDDTFLEEDEEEGDDVSGLLDVEAADEDEP